MAARTADFKVVQDPKVPLLDAPGGKQVAVAPKGTVLHGLAVLRPEDGLPWLRVDLAPGNPLREKRELLSIWALIATGDAAAPPLIEWDGPMDADLMGNIFQCKWAPPFDAAGGVEALYALESQPEGSSWHQFWKSSAGGQGSAEEDGGRVLASSNWPHFQKKVAVRVTASLTLQREPQGPACAKLVSSAFTVNAEMLDLRRLDKGVPHMRKTRSELAILRRKVEKNGGSDPEQVRQLEEHKEEVRRAQEIRSTILQRMKATKPKVGPVHTSKRILLSDQLGKAGPSANSQKFKKAVIMGLYHSCTNAVQKELEKRFDVEVANDWHTGKEGSLWKHRVNEREPEGLSSDCLIILMVKEPYFWLKSCCREPRNWFEIHPFKKNEETGELEDVPENKKVMEDLFNPLEHDTVLYPNAVLMWNDLVRSYCDDAVYNPRQSVIIRCEDFLFRFHEVMDQLERFGLQDLSVDRPEPLADRAKGHYECRTRDQALNFYASNANRTSDFSQEQLHIVSRDLDRPLLARLGYDGKNPVASWTDA